MIRASRSIAELRKYAKRPSASATHITVPNPAPNLIPTFQFFMFVPRYQFWSGKLTNIAAALTAAADSQDRRPGVLASNLKWPQSESARQEPARHSGREPPSRFDVQRQVLSNGAAQAGIANPCRASAGTRRA